jgi:hypothetical protein
MRGTRKERKLTSMTSRMHCPAADLAERAFDDRRVRKSSKLHTNIVRPLCISSCRFRIQVTFSVYEKVAFEIVT